MSKFSRVIAMILCIVMVLGMLPATAIAANDDNAPEVTIVPSETSEEEVVETAIPIYEDTSYSFEERAADLLGRMTLNQKIGFTTHSNTAIPASALGGGALNVPGTKNLGAYTWWNEALHGFYVGWSGQTANSMSYPQSLTVGTTWNPKLYYREASAIGDELRERVGKNEYGNARDISFFSPTVNMQRDPRWGRNEESYSEDPLLVSKMGEQFILGMEGKDQDGNLLDPDGYYKTHTTIKHYTLNNAERNRLDGSAYSDLRAIREYYTAPYRNIIQSAHVSSVMTSYNAVNTEPTSFSSYLMDTLLRQTFGFEGYVTSDCDSVSTMVRLNYTNPRTGKPLTNLEQFGGAMAHGEDIECAGGHSNSGSYASLMTQIIDAGVQTDKGTFTENTLDVSVHRILTARLQTGEIDDNLAYTIAANERIAAQKEAKPDSQVPNQTDERLALNEEVVNEAVVMLKNDGILPLNIPEGDFRVAIVGTWQTQTYFGLYTASQNISENWVNIQQGIVNAISKVNPDTQFDFITGYSLAEADAAKVEAADVVIVVTGTDGNYSKEDGDRTSIALSNNQAKLISDCGKLNDKTIAIMETCGPMQVNTFENDVSAILWSCFGGLRKGVGFGNVITGAVNPSGHLTATWHQNVSDTGESDIPDILDYTMYAVDGLSGRTYMYYEGETEPSYPFGYGLSYTTFEYSNLKIDKTEYDANDTVKVSFDVTNTGDVAGKEVTQLYIAQPEAPEELLRPIRRLEGFEKIELQPNETKTVEMDVVIPDLAYFNEETNCYEVDTGLYQVQVGEDSASADLTVDFTVSGEMDVYPELLTVKANQVGDTEMGIEQRIIFDKGATINPQITVAMNDESLYGYIIREQMSPIKALESTPLPEGMVISYESNRPEVVSVVNGELKAVGAGVATITVTGELDGHVVSGDFVAYVMASSFIDGITLDGKPLEGFNREKFNYELNIADFETAPVVGYVANTEGLEITVEQFDGIPGVAVITSVETDSGTTSVYRLGMGNKPVSTDFSEGWEAVEAKGWKVAGGNENATFGENGLTIVGEDGMEANFYSEPAYGEWAAQTNITLDQALSTNGQRVGLMVKDSDSNYILLTYEIVVSTGWWSSTNYYVTAYAFQEGQLNQIARTGNLGTLTGVSLRVIKDGDTFSFAYSTDGNAWTDMSGSVKMAMAEPKVGPFNGNVAGITATFDALSVAKVSELYPRLASVKLNGTDLSDFDPETFVYNFSVSGDATEAPVLEAVPADETVQVRYENLDTVTGVAKIVAYNDVASATYSFNFNYAPVSDYFADGDFNNALWTVERENKDAYSVEKGTGLVLPTQRYDIHSTGGAWENVFTAPAMGNWEVVAKMVYPEIPNASYQQGMLLVWQDEDNYIRMNCQESQLKLEPGVETNGSFVSMSSGNAVANEDGTVTLYYLIKKEGNNYTIGVSQDGVEYRDLGTRTVNLANPKIGLFATMNNSGATIDANFEYVAATWLGGVQQMTYDQMLVWAAQNVADYVAEDIPAEVTGDIEFSAIPHGYTMEVVSSNPDVISNDGVVTPAAEDKNVDLTITIREGATSASAVVTVKVIGDNIDPTIPIYENTQYTFEERAADLVARMSLTQKGSQLVSTASAISASALGGGALNVPATKGIANYEWWSEALHGYSKGNTSNSTSYPQNLTVASTWNPDLYYSEAVEIGDEIRERTQKNDLGNAKNLNFYSPTVNMHRDPRWGRHEESYSEDVYLTGKMGSMFVNGVEGKDKEGNIIDPNGYKKALTTVKHYTANNSERNRLGGGATTDLRAIREYYTAPYREVIQQAGVTSVMTAYSTLNGEPTSYSSYLMDTLLRQTFGLNGFVTSDCDSVATQNRHGYVNPFTGATMTDIEALSGALAHGEDLECSGGYSGYGTYSSKMTKMIDAASETDKGIFTENTVDVALHRLMTARISTGEFDENLAYTAAAAERTASQSGDIGWQTPERLAIIDEINNEGVVLLKNNGLLPLDIADDYNVVIVGAWQTNMYLGLYSAGQSNTTNQINIQKGITNAIKAENPNAVVSYIATNDLTAENEAAIAAADAVVVVTGTNDQYSKEDGDRTTIALPNGQDELISKVGKLNENTIAIMETCGPMQVTKFENDVAAILWASFGGLRKGIGFGNIITGAVNPSGKVTDTWHQNVSDAGESDVPSIYDYNLYATNGSNGRTYMYYVGENAPSYPFGYGLSYTTFEYSNLTMDKTEYDANDTIKVSFDVTNTGAVAGKEIAQLYVAQPDAPAELLRPIRRLQGFDKFELQPGETKTVEMEVAIPELAYFDETDKRYEVDTGAYQIQVGTNSAEANLTADFTVSGEMDVYPTLLTVKANAVGDSEAGIEERIIFDKGSIINPQLTVCMNDESLHGYIIANQQSPIDQLTSTPLPEGMTFTYKSNRPSVVKVTGDTIKAVDAGVATVTVTGELDGVVVTADFVVYVEATACIDGITLDGKPLEGFNREKFAYELDAADYETAPVVGYVANTEGLEVTVEQFTGIPGVATIKSVETASGTTCIYRVGIGGEPVDTDFAEGWEAAEAKGWTVEGANENAAFGEDGLTIVGEDGMAANFYSEPAYGEWAAQTNVTLAEALSTSGQRVGMMVKDTDDSYVMLTYEVVVSTGWWTSTNYYVTAYALQDGSLNQIARSGNLGTITDVSLRVIKTAGGFNFAYSTDGVLWTDMNGTAKVSMADPKIGPFCGNVAGVTATFDGIDVCEVNELYPRLASVTLNGAPLTEFDPETFVYNFEVAADATEVPVLEATSADESVLVAYEQLDTPFGAAKITAYNDVTKADYYFYFNHGLKSDYFADGDINEDLWTVERENKDTYSVVKGEGLVLPTQQSDIHGTGGAWENVFTAPAQGNWQAVAKMVYPVIPNANYQQAMFLVWQDENNYLRMNCQTSNLNMEPGVETNGSFNGNLGSGQALPSEDGTVTVYYLIEKDGNDYTVGYSQDGFNFTILNTAKNVNFANPRIGLFATQNSSATPINANFEYVAATRINGVEQMSYDRMLTWAAQNVADYVAEDVPAETAEDIVFSAIPHGYTMNVVSSDPSVISNDGVVTPAAKDKTVELNITISEGATTASAKATVKVPGTAGGGDEPVLGPVIVKDPESPTGYTGKFTYYDPDAEIVYFCGDLMLSNYADPEDTATYTPFEYKPGMMRRGGAQFKEEMQNLGNGYWYYELPLAAGANQYWFNVDDGRRMMPDPANHPQWSPNSDYDTKDAYNAVYVPYDEKQDFEPLKDRTVELPREEEDKGTWSYVPYTIGETTHYMAVYLPYGYDADRAEPYKTIYLLHGSGQDESDWMGIGSVQNIMDNLIAEGRTEPAVLVSLSLNNDAIGTSDSKFSNLFEVVLPFVEENYNVSTEAKDRSLSGLSMGSRNTKYVMETDALSFGYFGLYSCMETINMETENLDKAHIFVGVGQYESAWYMNATNTNITNLEEAGSYYAFEQVAGAHDFNTWNQLFRIYVEDYLWNPEAFGDTGSEDSGDLEAALKAVEAAKAAAEAAEAAAEAAAAEIAENKDAAEAALKAAEEAKAAAEAAQAAAEAADVAAAEKAAAAAESAAEAAKAQAAAQSAQAKAEAAQKAAEEAQAKADEAAAKGEAFAEEAQAAQEAADAAKKAAESAKAAAEAAKTAAEASNTAAAKAAAEAAAAAQEAANAQKEIAALRAAVIADKEEIEKMLEEVKKAELNVAKADALLELTMTAIFTGADAEDLAAGMESIEAAEDVEAVAAALEAALEAINCPSAIFPDVPGKDDWAHKGIDYAVANGLMEGTGNGLFKPEGTLTRAELVTILYRAAHEPKAEFKGVFTDVVENAWYADAVEWAASEGIVKGVGGSKFAPDAQITREQIATMLYRFAEKPAATGDLASFPDAASVGNYAKDAMLWATSNKIINGAVKDDVTYLAPLDLATREQIATIVMRYLELDK